MAMLLIAVLAPGLCSGLVGCSGSGGPAYDATYVFVNLRSGPHSGEGTKEERDAIFRGHMSNMRRLADEGKLLVAGPYDAPDDKTLRGLFLFDVASLDEARELVKTDPGVKAGEFRPELRPLSASSVLRKTGEYEKELLKNLPERKEGEPPPNIRPYVLVTTTNHKAFLAGLRGTEFTGKVVWEGMFKDGGGGGVVVLDAKDAAAVARTLGIAKLDGSAVGWWSTVSLMRLNDQTK